MCPSMFVKNDPRSLFETIVAQQWDRGLRAGKNDLWSSLEKTVVQQWLGKNDPMSNNDQRSHECKNDLRRLVAGFSQRRYVFTSGSVHVEYVLDKMALGQGFLQVLLFPLSRTFHRCSICTHISGGWTKIPLKAQLHREIVSPHRNNTIQDATMTSENISAATTYVMWREEHLLNVGVHQGEGVPLYAMEAPGGRGGIAPTHSQPRH
jgi:hypothetical protein